MNLFNARTRVLQIMQAFWAKHDIGLVPGFARILSIGYPGHLVQILILIVLILLALDYRQNNSYALRNYGADPLPDKIKGDYPDTEQNGYCYEL